MTKNRSFILLGVSRSAMEDQTPHEMKCQVPDLDAPSVGFLQRSAAESGPQSMIAWDFNCGSKRLLCRVLAQAELQQ